MKVHNIRAMGINIVTINGRQYCTINCMECHKPAIKRVDQIKDVFNEYCGNICRHKKDHIVIKCSNCSKELNIWKSRFNIIKTCSIACTKAVITKKVYFNCINCGKQDHYAPSQDKYHNGNGKFCTVVCRDQYYRKFPTNRPSYKTGFTYDSAGYAKSNALGTKDKRIHVLIMEQCLGRKLQTSECVHHIDKDKSNNKLSNLVLMTISEHHKLHYRDRKIDSKGRLLPITEG